MGQKKTSGALLSIGGLIAGVTLAGPVMLGQLASSTLAVSNTACTSTLSASANDQAKNPINIPEEYVAPLKKASAESGIPVEILAAQLKQESNFRADAVSPAGAMGPAQFTRETWAAYGNGGDIFNVEDAVGAMGRYMKDLKGMVEKYANGDATMLIKLTLAAYNAGPGNVEAYKGIPPFTETQHYIEVITAGAQVNFSSTCSASEAVAWDGDLGDGEWTSPLPNSTMSSGYGPRSVPNLPAWAQQHVGIDLLTGSGFSPGGPVVAPTDLDITGFFQKDHCLLATAKDGSDLRMAFCHLEKADVSPGQTVKRGDIIGQEGNYGESVATLFITHLHYEIYKPGEPLTGENYNPYNGQTLNPEPILKEKGAWNF